MSVYMVKCILKSKHTATHTKIVLCENVRTSDKGLEPFLRAREPPMSTQTCVNKTKKKTHTHTQRMHKGVMKYLWGGTDLPYSFLFLLLKGVNGEITHTERGKGHRHGATLMEKKNDLLHKKSN